MHQFATDPVLRTKWVKFVQGQRDDLRLVINKSAALRIVYFEENCHIALQLEVHRETVKKNYEKGLCFNSGHNNSSSLKSQSEANGR